MLQNLQKNNLSRNFQTSVLQQGLFGFLRQKISSLFFRILKLQKVQRRITFPKRSVHSASPAICFVISILEGIEGNISTNEEAPLCAFFATSQQQILMFLLDLTVFLSVAPVSFLRSINFISSL